MKEKNKSKKYRKILFLILFLVIIAISMTTFGRYVFNSFREMYLSSHKFYFTSNVLGENKSYSNWGGTESYMVSFELYSYDNELRKMETDLPCQITATVKTGSATCYVVPENDALNKTTHTATLNETILLSENNKKKVRVYIVPNSPVANNGTVSVEISAKTTEPFEKELKSTITLTSTDQSDYKIKDKVFDDYARVILSNSKQEDVTITLEFNPSEVQIDSNDEIFSATDTTYTTTTVSGVTYMNTVKFKLSKEKAKDIKFYKVDKRENYTYEQNSSETSNSIVNVKF